MVIGDYYDVEDQSNNAVKNGLGLYREPRLNKSDSASLSQYQQQQQMVLNGHGGHFGGQGGHFGGHRGQGSNLPLSPNSIDNRSVP